MANGMSTTVNGVQRNVIDGYVTVNGVHRKLSSVWETVNGVWRKVWTAIPPYDPSIPGTFSIGLNAEASDNGKQGAYTTLFTRSKANEAIANGYSRITMDYSVTIKSYSWEQRWTLYSCITDPSSSHWGRDDLAQISGEYDYSTFTGTVSFSLSDALGWSGSIGNAFGVFVGLQNMRGGMFTTGTITNVRFTK